MPFVNSILQSIPQLPPLPAVLQRLLQLRDDPQFSAPEVVDALEYDQAIPTNVLMVGNSAKGATKKI